MINKIKIFAIYISYNAEKTLTEFYENFPKELVDEIILIDDCSQDNTFKIAKDLGIKSYQNPKNLGYGGNLKRGISIALEQGADIIIDIHPDGEYNPSVIPIALEKVSNGAEFVLGNRFTDETNPLHSGMFLWKYIGLKILNSVEKLILGRPATGIDDLHQGFRVYTKKFLGKVNYLRNSDNYLFSFEIVAQAVSKNISIAQVPVKTKYVGSKRGASLKHCIVYTTGTFKILILFILSRLGRRIEIFEDS
jgi:glycosyltransferase involved in cell wall biosynthesis